MFSAFFVWNNCYRRKNNETVMPLRNTANVSGTHHCDICVENVYTHASQKQSHFWFFTENLALFSFWNLWGSRQCFSHLEDSSKKTVGLLAWRVALWESTQIIPFWVFLIRKLFSKSKNYGCCGRVKKRNSLFFVL